MLIFAHEFPCDIYSYEKEYILALLALCATLVSAQEDWRVVRGECLPTGLPEHSYADNNRLAHSKRLPAMNNQWDATKTYKQLVILLDFCDQTFSRDNIREEYERILNEPGYNESEGMGCMADYFRIQSDGLLNLQFDVYGPYTVSQKAQPYEKQYNSKLWARIICGSNQLIYRRTPGNRFLPV
jgi:hypothetical protein